jgi:hypothetical protein
LRDIPSRLVHKYTDNLEDLEWTELIELDDKQLEERDLSEGPPCPWAPPIWERIENGVDTPERKFVSVLNNELCISLKSVAAGAY